MSKNDKPDKNDAPDSAPGEPPPLPEPPKTGGKKVPLKAFLSDRKTIKKHGRAVIKAFESEYRAEPARDDWSKLLLEFVSKPR